MTRWANLGLLNKKLGLESRCSIVSKKIFKKLGSIGRFGRTTDDTLRQPGTCEQKAGLGIEV